MVNKYIEDEYEKIDLLKGIYVAVAIGYTTNKFLRREKDHFSKDVISIESETLAVYYFKYIAFEQNIIISENSFESKGRSYDFIEGLNAFVKNNLILEKDYFIYNEDYPRYTATLIAKKDTVEEALLDISIKKNSKMIRCSKYECRVIVSKFNRIYNACKFFDN